MRVFSQHLAGSEAGKFFRPAERVDIRWFAADAPHRAGHPGAKQPPKNRLDHKDVKKIAAGRESLLLCGHSPPVPD